MTIRPAMWRRIRYTVFLALFASLFATYWAYSYETNPSTEGVQTIEHPYRNYTILLAAFSALLFGIYAYSGHLERNSVKTTI